MHERRDHTREPGSDGMQASWRTVRTHPDLICLSHLRWAFVYQRPQHLMARFVRDRRVFFVEEPLRDGDRAHLSLRIDASGVFIAEPHIPASLNEGEASRAMELLMHELLTGAQIEEYALWYLTPMALAFARHLDPVAIVFDCMDELAAFKFAPPDIVTREAELLGCADLVFTGGRSLHEAKRRRHPNVHCCPSSVDVAHFRRARQHPTEPADQADIPRPRIGYAGVIDERMDLALVDAIAARRPDWQVVLLGPIAKIDPDAIPQRSNVHALGARPYVELPAYLAHWQAALLPFALNDATRFISPTKTPEYLAAGLPVVSTPLTDVVTPYGDLGLVRIADRPDTFIAAIADALADEAGSDRLAAVDTFLGQQSWDSTWRYMRDQLDTAVARRRAVRSHVRLLADTGPTMPLVATSSGGRDEDCERPR
jgi:glycosyltransferase involved in cell wall biosynthesis